MRWPPLAGTATGNHRRLVSYSGAPGAPLASRGNPIDCAELHGDELHLGPSIKSRVAPGKSATHPDGPCSKTSKQTSKHALVAVAGTATGNHRCGGRAGLRYIKKGQSGAGEKCHPSGRLRFENFKKNFKTCAGRREPGRRRGTTVALFPIRAHWVQPLSRVGSQWTARGCEETSGT